MKDLEKVETKRFGSSIKKMVLVTALGMSCFNMTGCQLGIDDMITGITSNVCVLAGKCNGSTRM